MEHIPSFVPAGTLRTCVPPRPRVTSMCANTPDAGLIAKAGVTGTTSANLWPIPILGAYGWFLNVYRRDAAQRCGAFRVHVAHPRSLSISFAPDVEARDGSARRGVATSRYSVKGALCALGLEADEAHDLVLFEDKSATFWTRRYEVRAATREREVWALWEARATAYVVHERGARLEVREHFDTCRLDLQGTGTLDYFAMNLNPLPLFSAYSCVVCVWRQCEQTSAVAIDKRGKEVRLLFVDATKTDSGEASGRGSRSLGWFAVRAFFGGVTDAVAHREHALLLAAVDAQRGFDALSRTDFRIVMQNVARTVTAKRKCEIM
eukprot:IDg3539t1